jgi:hypothetical protein
MAFGMSERKNTCIDIMPQNLRGFREEKGEEIILRMVQRNLWVACLQETWRIGDNMWENGGLTFIHHGFSEKPCNRGALGVAIALSSEARKSWERAGSKILYFGPRILATRLRGAYASLTRKISFEVIRRKMGARCLHHRSGRYRSRCFRGQPFGLRKIKATSAV